MRQLWKKPFPAENVKRASDNMNCMDHVEFVGLENNPVRSSRTVSGDGHIWKMMEYRQFG